jgi:hypothetical protein
MDLNLTLASLRAVLAVLASTALQTIAQRIPNNLVVVIELLFDIGQSHFDHCAWDECRQASRQ